MDHFTNPSLLELVLEESSLSKIWASNGIIFWREIHKNWWKKVRKEWDKVFVENKEVKLKDKVDAKRLYQHFFVLDDNASNKEIRAIIDKFLN